MNTKIIATLIAAAFSTQALAQEEEKEYQDMSDPLAVYTQVGGGITDKGFNLKIGQTYDTGSDVTMGMNIVEVKGFGGDMLGIRDNDDPLYQTVDNSIDSIRFRNFSVDLTTGRGAQIDVNINVDNETSDASYSLIQALPKMGAVQLYPLAGVGVSMENDADDGFEVPGAFVAAGFYSKITITDKVWLNYNPLWVSTVAGSDQYKDHYYANESNLFTHEFSVSYQISPRANIRYFANWNEKVDFDDGDHRIEFNYQL